MAFADALRVFGSCKIQPFGNHLPSSGTNLRCYCSSPSRASLTSALRFNVTEKPKTCEKIGFLTIWDNMSVGADMMYHDLPHQLLSVTVMMVDEDGQLARMFEELVRKETFELDVLQKTNIVLDEIVPKLLENYDCWMSSRFIVSLDLKESMDKLFETEEMSTEYVDPLGLNNISCTKVFVDVSIMGVINEEFKDVRTHEEMKALLYHLMSRNCVRNASSLCARVLVSKETLSKA